MQSQQILDRPLSIRDTGLTAAFLSDLVLKVIYNAGETSVSEISRELCLPFVGVVQPVLALLDREELISAVGAGSFGEQVYRYTLSRKGIERARQALEQSQYAGPAPVPLARYNAMVRAQAAAEVSLDEAAVREAFAGLVVDPAMLDRVGAALNSGRSVFLCGPSGNGKTTIAARMARLLARDRIYVPYTVSVDGYLIEVYDGFHHKRIGGATAQEQPSSFETGRLDLLDERWVLVERPAVVAGAELSLQSLDLIWDPIAGYYEAPVQMKANGGMLLIDDFGRQHIDPQDLLNRWMVPLETRLDFLSLHTGKKIEIPFEQLVVFATNLDPTALVDEAFLRRIRHKIKVDNPTVEEFHEVFQRACSAREVRYTREGFVHLVREWYAKPKRDFRNAHPRAILDQLLDIARYKRLEPAATLEMIDMACSAYLVDL